MSTPFIGDGEPVDGFSVVRQGEAVAIILSNRYGHADRFVLDLPDAVKMATALLIAAQSPQSN